MEKTGDDAASRFINALIKSVQTLCHGYLDFHNGIEIIGHINLSVDKGNSMDYILKEKVCKNAENSTLFISNSFHAEPKPEQEVPGKNSQSGNQVVQSKQSTDSASGESGKVSSAISSISSALSSSRERHRRSSAKDPDSHSQQSTAKRKASEDHSESRPAKVPSHHDQTSSGSPFPPASLSPEDSKVSLRALASMGTSDAELSETMLPQTANVTSDNAADIGVNLAGSVLEPVDDQSNPDLPERDDDSDGDLEVTFIKEEYVEGERSACEYDNSGQQFGDSHHRGSEGMPDPSLFPIALHSSSSASATYVPSAHELGAIAQHFPPGSVGPSTSQPQPGPSGMRGISGVQSYVNSLSALGSLGAPGLPLARAHGPPGHSKQSSVLPRTPGSNISLRCQRTSYSNSHLSLQRAFALYRDDKRKKRAGRKEEEVKTKERLDLMNAGYRQLLEQEGATFAEGYKRIIEREKRRMAKKLYRATLSERKKDEIKQKDKERKRMKRASKAATAASADMSNIMQQFSLSFSDGVPTLGSNSLSASGLGSRSVGSVPCLGSSTMGSIPSMNSGSVGSVSGLGLDVVGSGSGPSSGSVGHITGTGIIGNLTDIGTSMTGHISDTNSGSVGSASWIDSVSFDTCSEEQGDTKSTGCVSEGSGLSKLNQNQL